MRLRTKLYGNNLITIYVVVHRPRTPPLTHADEDGCYPFREVQRHRLDERWQGLFLSSASKSCTSRLLRFDCACVYRATVSVYARPLYASSAWHKYARLENVYLDAGRLNPGHTSNRLAVESRGLWRTERVALPPAFCLTDRLLPRWLCDLSHSALSFRLILLALNLIETMNTDIEPALP